MFQYILKRLIIALPVLLGVTMITYLIISLAPGDVVDLQVDPNFSQSDRVQMRRDLGLDQPIPVRYVKWLGQTLKGNLGYSYTTRTPVATRIGERIGPTVGLSLAALFIAYLIAIPVGVISATRQYSWVDHSSTGFALTGVSIPGFFLGMILIYVFSLKLKLLPVSGMRTLGLDSSPIDLIKHMILPTVVLATGTTAAVMRYTRSAMLEIVRQDYIRTARSKGLSERLVIYKHALRNAILPVITLLGLQIPALVSGAVITEQIFGWPGIGRLNIDAIGARDYPVLMGLNLLAAVMVITGGLVADVMYAAADPRIRYS
jgi:peptide/nickel transport system permease protein